MQRVTHVWLQIHSIINFNTYCRTLLKFFDWRISILLPSCLLVLSAFCISPGSPSTRNLLCVFILLSLFFNLILIFLLFCFLIHALFNFFLLFPAPPLGLLLLCPLLFQHIGKHQGALIVLVYPHEVRLLPWFVLCRIEKLQLLSQLCFRPLPDVHPDVATHCLQIPPMHLCELLHDPVVAVTDFLCPPLVSQIFFLRKRIFVHLHADTVQVLLDCLLVVPLLLQNRISDGLLHVHQLLLLHLHWGMHARTALFRFDPRLAHGQSS
mmetsp:Transcript_5863/g.11642  ORF Transcript_5863/g.11642 Transcript_5863/m.11642 type:complete len:266 (-) Transcript_5863:89-886(-)